MDQFNRTNRPDMQRAQRPVDQRASTAQSAARPQTAGAQHVKQKRLSGKWKKIALIAGVVLLVVALGYGAWRTFGGGTGIVSNRYQAVFLTNGQVYFGKLTRMNAEYYQLTDIYYMQATSSTGSTDPKNPQETSQAGGNVQIIKLGDEIHGPEDKMIIGKDQVLFYENLKTKDGSKVVSAIADYQAKKK